jgi:lysophospholipase L1-like esterase
MDRKRKRLFTIITFSIPLLFFIFLEVGLRMFDYGQEYPLFVEDPVDDQYLYMNREVSLRYFSDQEFATVGQYDVFTKNKDSNTFRIVVQGASTSAGFPYNHSLSFPRLLEQKIQYAYPDKKIEVINTSMSAVNSFTLLDFADEIIAQAPDLVLIYAGHNEYYGALGVGSSQKIGGSYFFTSLYLRFKSYKTLELLKNIIVGVSSKKGDSTDGETLMDRMVATEGIPFNSSLYDQGILQYKSNMAKLLSKYQKAGIKTYLSTLVSNLHDHKPFKSDENGEYNAEERFNQGLELESESDYNESLLAFSEARDFDLLKFRAPSGIENQIPLLAEEYGAELIDVNKVFAQNSPNGIIGKSLLLEHVHPNIEGQKLMADIFFETIRQSEVLGQTNNSIVNFKYNYTELDSLHGKTLVEQLMTKWPFTNKVKVVNRDVINDTETDLLVNQLIGEEVTWVQAMDIAFKRELERNPSEALRLAKSLNQEYPHVLQPFLLIAKSHEKLGQIALAEEVLSSIPRQLASVQVSEELLAINIRSGRFVTALKYAREVARIKPNNNTKLNTLALEDITNAKIATDNLGELIATEELGLLIRASGALIYIQRSDIANDLLLGLNKKYPNNVEIKELIQQLK